MKKIIASIVILVSLVGCTTYAPKAAVSDNKKIHISTAVSSPVFDGVSTTANIVTFQMTDPETGRQVEKEVVYVNHSSPLGKDVVTAVAGTVPSALIYRSAIKGSGCRGTCAPVLTSIAGAEAANQAVSNVGVNVGTGLGKYGR